MHTTRYTDPAGRMFDITANQQAYGHRMLLRLVKQESNRWRTCMGIRKTATATDVGAGCRNRPQATETNGNQQKPTETVCGRRKGNDLN